MRLIFSSYLPNMRRKAKKEWVKTFNNKYPFFALDENDTVKIDDYFRGTSTKDIQEITKHLKNLKVL